MTGEPLARVIGVLEHVKRSGAGYEARCPGSRHKHGDKTPSLSINVGDDGRVLLKCHAGCEAGEILTALGLTWNDLFEHSPSGNPVRRFRLTNGAGQVVAEHVREDLPNDKIIRWERNGHGGLGGIKTVDLPLYRLPALLADRTSPVIVCEGEKAAQALADVGLLAVATVTGAGNIPSDEMLEPLQGREVWLWPDNDTLGREHMTKIAAKVRPPPRWIDWPDAPDKGDAADYIAGGGAAESVVGLLRPVDGAGPWMGPAVKTGKQLAAATFTSVRWAIPGLLPAGLTILAGRPKLGKSWLALGWALDIARGTVALRRMNVVTGETLYLALEDGERRMQERMAMMLGDAEAPELFNVVVTWPRLDEGGLDLLEQWLLIHPKTRLVVIDTFKRIRPIEKGNQRLYDLDYDAIAPIAEMARTRNVAIVLVFHTRKMQSDDPLESVSGTLGVSGAADAVMVLKRERGQADASLFATGRDIEEQDLALRWEKEDTLGWALLGDAVEFRLSAERREVLDLIEAAPGMTPSELSDALGKPRGVIRRLLFSMVRDAEVRARDGKYFPLARARADSIGNAGNARNDRNLDHALHTRSNGNAQSQRGVTDVTTVTAVTGVTGVTAQSHGLCMGCGRPFAVHGEADPIKCQYREKNHAYYE